MSNDFRENEHPRSRDGRFTDRNDMEGWNTVSDLDDNAPRTADADGELMLMDISGDMDEDCEAQRRAMGAFLASDAVELASFSPTSTIDTIKVTESQAKEIRDWFDQPRRGDGWFDAPQGVGEDDPLLDVWDMLNPDISDTEEFARFRREERRIPIDDPEEAMRFARTHNYGRSWRVSVYRPLDSSGTWLVEAEMRDKGDSKRGEVQDPIILEDGEKPSKRKRCLTDVDDPPEGYAAVFERAGFHDFDLWPDIKGRVDAWQESHGWHV